MDFALGHILGLLLGIPVASLVLALFVRGAFVVVEKGGPVSYARSYATAIAINSSAWLFTTGYLVIAGAEASPLGLLVSIVAAISVCGAATGRILKTPDGYPIGFADGVKVNFLTLAASFAAWLIVMGVLLPFLESSAQGNPGFVLGFCVFLLGALGAGGLIWLYRRAAFTATANGRLKVASGSLSSSPQLPSSNAQVFDSSTAGVAEELRVARRPGGDLVSPQWQRTPVPSRNDKDSVSSAGSPMPQQLDPRLSTHVSDDSNEDLWELAHNELIQGTPKAGLWARVFAESDGNEDLAKARYLRERARQLHGEREHLNAVQKQERLEEARKTEEASRQAQAAKLKWLGTGSVTREQIIMLVHAATTSDPALVNAAEFMTGKTLLHLCVKEGLNEEALELVRRGADPSRPNGSGQTAYDLAHDEGMKQAVGSARRDFLERHNK